MIKRKNIRDIMGVGAMGLAIPLGAKAVSQAGGDASGIAALSGFQSPIGTLIGTKITLDMLQDINKPFLKQQRRRR